MGRSFFPRELTPLVQRMRDQKANSAPANLDRDKEAEVALTPERWRLMKELFGAALQHEPAERSAFLREACGSDEPLRAEIEALAHRSRHVHAGAVDHRCWPVPALRLVVGR